MQMNRSDQLHEHFLYPSAIYASKAPTRVTTVLGTCVAVCLWDKKLGVGGINHYMLPLWNGEGLASPKYGNIAIEKLHEKMLEMGSSPSNIVAKIFGGKENVIEVDTFRIGPRNFEFAIEKLNDLRIPIVAKSIGGKHGRKILFNTQTGEVLMKLVNSLR